MSAKMNRRSFLTTTAVVGAAGLVGGQLLTACSGGKKGDKLTPLKEPGSYYIPEGVLAAGNPCRVIRKITPEDRDRYIR